MGRETGVQGDSSKLNLTDNSVPSTAVWAHEHGGSNDVAEFGDLRNGGGRKDSSHFSNSGDSWWELSLATSGTCYHLLLAFVLRGNSRERNV